MCKTWRILLTGILLTFLSALGTQAANYVLDDGAIRYPLNASDGTEPRDNWFGNVFTAQASATLITRVDFGVFTTTSNSPASVVIYRVTDPGGNPAPGGYPRGARTHGARRTGAAAHPCNCIPQREIRAKHLPIRPTSSRRGRSCSSCQLARRRGSAASSICWTRNCCASVRPTRGVPCSGSRCRPTCWPWCRRRGCS